MSGHPLAFDESFYGGGGESDVDLFAQQALKLERALAVACQDDRPISGLLDETVERRGDVLLYAIDQARVDAPMAPRASAALHQMPDAGQG